MGRRIQSSALKDGLANGLASPFRGLGGAVRHPVSKYALAIGLLSYVIWSNWEPKSGLGLKTVWEERITQGKIHYQFFALAAAICLASLMITLVRWYVLVRAVNLPFRLLDAFRLGFIGLFFNTFLPGSVGGDIIKAAFLAREQDRRTVAVATVIMDRAIALWALIWFVALLGGAFWAGGFLEGSGFGVEQSKLIIQSAAGIVAVTLTLWLLMGLLPAYRAERFASRLERIPKVGGSAAEFWRAVWMYRCRQRSVAACMLVSWVGHVGFVLTFYFSVRTLWEPGERIPELWQHFLVVPIGLVINAMPLFPGGAGIGELGFGGLYRWLDCDAAIGVLGSLVQRVIMWSWGAAGYLVYLRMKPALKQAKVSTTGDFDANAEKE